MAPRCAKDISISSTIARDIERRATKLTKRGTLQHMALTRAAEEVLGCKPRRALAGEGSLNYFKSIGRFFWDGDQEARDRHKAVRAYNDLRRKGHVR